MTPSHIPFSIFHEDAPIPIKAAKAAAAIVDSVLGEGSKRQLCPLLMVGGLPFPYIPAPHWVGGEISLPYPMCHADEHPGLGAGVELQAALASTAALLSQGVLPAGSAAGTAGLLGLQPLLRRLCLRHREQQEEGGRGGGTGEPR